MAVNFANTAIYIVAQFLGAFAGAVIAWLAYKQHYDAHENKAEILGTFATGRNSQPTVEHPHRDHRHLCLGRVGFYQGGTPAQVGPLAVALVIVAIGASLGGPTGYAINPARDLGPMYRPRHLADQGQGRVRLGLLLGAGRWPDHRRCSAGLCSARTRSTSSEFKHSCRLTSGYALVRRHFHETSTAPARDISQEKFLL